MHHCFLLRTFLATFFLQTTAFNAWRCVHRHNRWRRRGRVAELRVLLRLHLLETHALRWHAHSRAQQQPLGWSFSVAGTSDGMHPYI